MNSTVKYFHSCYYIVDLYTPLLVPEYCLASTSISPLSLELERLGSGISTKVFTSISTLYSVTLKLYMYMCFSVQEERVHGDRGGGS